MKIFLSLTAAMCLFVSTANAQVDFTFSTSATDPTAGSLLDIVDGAVGSLFIFVENNDPSGEAIEGLALDVTDSGTTRLNATLFDIQNPENADGDDRWFTTDPGDLGSTPSLVTGSNAIFIPGFGDNTGIENGVGPVLHAELQFSVNGLGSNTVSLEEGANTISVNGGAPDSVSFGTATVNVINPDVVPEPSSLALVGTLFGAAMLRRRRSN